MLYFLVVDIEAGTLRTEWYFADDALLCGVLPFTVHVTNAAPLLWFIARSFYSSEDMFLEGLQSLGWVYKTWLLFGGTWSRLRRALRRRMGRRRVRVR